MDIHSRTKAEVEAAVKFYEQSPDGQYDEIAVEALKYVLVCMECAEKYDDRW